LATPLKVPSPSEIRDNYLRTQRSGDIARGVPNPNVTRGSDAWVRAEALAQQLSVVHANQQFRVDQLLPDTAEDDDLGRWLKIFGIGFRPAQGATGPVVLAGSAAVFVPTGTQLIDGQGELYEVVTGGTFNVGDLITIQGTSTGLATNHQQGEVLTWVGTAPTFAKPTVLVGVGGLKDGADADTNESARNRLFSLLRTPRGAGNWPQVKAWAEQVSPIVTAYVYPAINGPGTLGICVLGPLSWDPTLGWTREVTPATVNAVATYVASQLPGGGAGGDGCVNLVVATPTDTVSSSPAIDTDVSIGLALPVSSAGGGPGGGWVDATPWPALLGTSTKVTVQTVTSSTDVTLTSDDAGTTPSTAGLIAGQTTVAWFSSSNFAAGQDPLIVATVVSVVSGTTGAVRITLSVPFTGIVAGDFVMPNAENIQDYARAWLAAMAAMGPGEWSAHAQVLVDGKRRPLNAASNPYSFGGVQTRAISDVGEEVQDVTYLARNIITPAPGVAVTPGNPATAPPNVLVPRRIGFYNKIT
jgi:hypothetical protein